jgi:hypothetical protein
MDPTGLLDAVLAVAVYPGALFLGVAAVLHRAVAGRAPGRLPGGSLSSTSTMAVVAAIAAVAMLPLTGSPALTLPPPSGAAGNVLAVAMLFAVAVDRGAGGRPAGLLAAVAAAPVLALAAAAGTFSVQSISSESGTLAMTARVLAATSLLLAAAAPPAPGGRTSSVVRAGLALGAASLTIPAAAPAAAPVAVALMALGVVVVAALAGRVAAVLRPRVSSAATVAVALAGTVLALLATHA